MVFGSILKFTISYASVHVACKTCNLLPSQTELKFTLSLVHFRILNSNVAQYCAGDS